MMTLALTTPFLNQPMLWGLLMIATPVIIHLLNKRRFKRVRWGAMQFLHASLSRVSRRMRMENLLLLLLRILIVMLIVGAFARPYLSTKFTVGGILGETKTAMVILLDTSMSMGYAREGKPNLEHAKEAAKQLVGTLKQGDSVSVFAVTDKTESLSDLGAPFLDFQRARDKIDALQSSHRSADFFLAVDTAIRHMQTLRNPVKEVFIITDMQQTGWRLDKPDENEWAAISEPLKNTVRFPQKPPFKIVDVSGGETENAAVVNLSFSPPVIGPDREVRIDCEFRNFGKTVREVALTPVVDGMPKPNLGRPVRLEPERNTTESIYVRFDSPGSHQVTVEIGSDPLTVDNKRYLALDVLKEVRVLVVNGAPSVQPFRGETDFLVTALSPTPRMRLESESMSIANPELVGLQQLGSENFANYPVIILANVANLGAPEMDRLEKFVFDGGGLLIFPGDLVDSDFYNSLFRDGTGILPAALIETEGDEKDRDKYATIEKPPYSHPALEVFKDPARADLTTGRIYRWFKLDPPLDNPSVRVMASLNNGMPFLIEKTVGRGRVILCAVPCDADWADLPVRKFYVPLMHELVYHLASGNRPDLNVLLGQPLVFKSVSEPVKPDAALARLPDGTTKPLKFTPEDGAWFARSDATTEPGFHKIEVETADGRVIWDYAVNVQPAEFDLTPLDDRQKQTLHNALGVEIVLPKELEGLAPQRFGVEIWRQIAYLLLGLLFVELLMTSRRTRRQEVEQVNVPEAVLNR